MTVLILLVALLIVIIAVVFALQNAIPVTISFLVWQLEGSLALVLLASFMLGVLAALLVTLPGMIRRGTTIVSLKREISGQEKAITTLEKEQAKAAPPVKSTPAKPAVSTPAAPAETPAKPDEKDDISGA